MARRDKGAALLQELQDWDVLPSELRGGLREKITLPPHLKPQPNEHPADFLKRTLPDSPIPTGARHMAVWDWVAALRPGQPAPSRVEIWARGGGKSDTAEKACAYLACALTRRFALYVCGNQDQADDHVQNIAALLERMGIPRAVNAYSASINWTAKQLQTAHGFGVLGVGLNARVRGARWEDNRPDLIILDDVDGEHDGPHMVQKKLATISKAILPAGSSDATVLFIQNRIHKDSVIAQIADRRSELLLGASITIEPAAYDLEWERDVIDGEPCYRVTGGRPTWEQGQDLAVIERQINQWTLPVFLSESQHEDAPDGGLWKRERDIDPYRVGTAPATFARIVIGIDPPGGATEAGIVAVGKTHDGHFYVLHDDSGRGTPAEWMRRAIERYWAVNADTLVVETNFGGDMVKAGIRSIDPRVGIKEVKASRGKLVRAEPVHQLYQDGKVHHVGVFPDLERELCTWHIGMSSPNRLDALVWAIVDLMQTTKPLPMAQSVAVWG
jgi:hypothetical protein